MYEEKGKEMYLLYKVAIHVYSRFVNSCLIYDQKTLNCD